MTETIWEGRAVLATGRTPSSWIGAKEQSTSIHIEISGGINARLTPVEARRLARHLRTLATRVENRAEGQQ